MSENMVEGWNKTYLTFDKIPKSDDSIDCHSWVIHKSRLIDYPLEELMKCSLFATDKVVRKPFPKMLQVQVLPHIIKIWKDKKEGLDLFSKDFQSEIFHYWNNSKGNCIMKSIEYWINHKHDGAKIVFGSLGFVQTNGYIFYEYG